MYKTIPKRANKIKAVQSKSSHNAWFLNLKCQVSYRLGPVIDETQLGQWGGTSRLTCGRTDRAKAGNAFAHTVPTRGFSIDSVFAVNC